MQWFARGLAACCFVSFAMAAEVKRSDLKSGLVFESTDESGFRVSRLEPSVGLTLNSGEAAHPHSDGGQSFSWKGHIQIVSGGTYKFEATLRGKVRVEIDGKAVLDVASKGEAAVLAGNEIELKPGIYPFETTLARLDESVRLQLRWVGPRFRLEPIPGPFFGHLPAQRPEQFVGDLQRDYGRLLFEELACVKCHAAKPGNALASGLAPRGGPNLSKIAERTNSGWLDAWLENPKSLRPHTAMPGMFADDSAGKAERYAVVAYLTSLGKPSEPRPPKPQEVVASAARGKKLYLLAGCATCHGDNLNGPPTAKPKEDDEVDVAFDPKDSTYGAGSSTGPKSHYQLGNVGNKFKPEALAKWLKNPLETNPHGRMPNMRLDDQQALDIARYLCTAKDEKIGATKPEMPKLEPSTLVVKADAMGVMEQRTAEARWIAAGKSLFASKGCANCHEIEGVKSLSIAKEFDAISKSPTSGCVSEKLDSSKVPNFGLPKYDREALVAFLKAITSIKGAKSPVHSARVALKRFNCLNCHQRDKEGGIETGLANLMKSLESAENADDVQPPLLTGVGSKLRTSWMKTVLLDNGRARPWMNLRMPQFGDANVAKLHEQLPLLEGAVPDDAIGKATFTKEKIETGRALAGKQGHGCISCHDISGQRGGGTRGPDLATTNQRVRFDWYARWMHQPQRMAPGTKMPQAFIDGKALLTEYYAGDGDKQIEALWAYFSLGPGLPLPAGLEPPKGLVILPKDKPELLRTFLPDNAGTKCIAVGYPSGLNIAFDSTQCRIAYAWSGNFLEMSPVWNDRGGNPAKLLGTKFWTGPPGHPWASGSSSEAPDFAKQAVDPAYGGTLSEGKTYTGPMGLKFRGYSLDDGGKPTFSYSIAGGEIKIDETPQPLTSIVSNGFIRSFKIEAPANRTVWYRVMVTPTEPKLLTVKGEAAVLPDSLPCDGNRIVVGKDSAKVFGADSGNWKIEKAGNEWTILWTATVPKADQPLKLVLKTWDLPKAEPSLLAELK